jgi:hypothetical protein
VFSVRQEMSVETYEIMKHFKLTVVFVDLQVRSLMTVIDNSNKKGEWG